MKYFLYTLPLLLVPSPLLGQAESTFRAGAATSNITLPLGASAGGVIARGGAAVHIHDELHARCLVLDDGKTRLAIVLCDLRMIGRAVVAKALKRIANTSSAGSSRGAGLSPKHVLIAATHTHAAPAVVGIHTKEIDRVYTEFLAVRIADAVQRAVNNLRPAKIGWGFADVPNHVHNRRWFMKPGTIPPNPFGETTDKVRMNPPRGNPALLKPAGPVDSQLAVVSVQDKAGKPLCVLANYGLHYIGGYQRGYVSSDYFGLFASNIQELLQADNQDPPFVGILSNGTSGDVNNINFRQTSTRAPPWIKMRTVADDLAKAAMRALGKIEYQDKITLAVATAELQLGVRRPDAKRLQWARKTLKTVKNRERLTRPEVYASEALALARFPDKVPVNLQVMRIGKLSIAAVPCEVFAETGLVWKKHSALGPMFTIELANGYNGYLPTPEQHKLGGYETWPARSSYLEVGAETQIRRAVVELARKCRLTK